MGKDIAIIGAGVVGVCSAYYLQKAGHRVHIFEKNSKEKESCSYGNAGMVVPSHFIPLAAPGMMSKGLKWMLDQESPFYIKPRFNGELFRWMYAFYRSANQAHVEHASPFLKDYNAFSKSCFEAIKSSGDIDFHYEQKGLLMLCQSDKSAEEEKAIGESAKALGLEANWYPKERLHELEPDVQINAIGGLHFPGDAHLTPGGFMRGIIAYLEKSGVHFHWNTQVKNLEIAKGKVQTIHATSQTFQPDEVIVSAGAWSAKFLKSLGTQILLQGGKGYSFEVNQTSIRIPSILTDAKVAVTPMDGFTRFAGTMEINGTDESINGRRVNGIVKSVSRYYPEITPQVQVEKVWQGLRPCSPDGLPYLGRHKSLSNLVVATGHAMMGLSLGPGTGKIVADLIDGNPKKLDLSLTAVHRFDKK